MTDPSQQQQPDPAAAAAQEAARAAASSDASRSNPNSDTGADPARVANATRPDYLPESFWDSEKNAPKADEFKAHLTDLEKFKADADARRASLPANADAYKPELPQGVKLPDNVSIDDKDPRFIELRNLAHEAGLDQTQFSKILKLDADRVIAQQTQLNEAIKQRDAALGDNGAARVEALKNWIDSVFPDSNEAMQVKQTMWTPVIVKFFEGVQKLMTSQGVQSFSQVGREGAEVDDGLPSNWNQMSAIDRRQWQLANPKKTAA